MRLKLVIISSLVAALVGAGSAIAIILTVFSSLKPISSPGLLVLSTYLLPMLMIVLSTMFVYRHTARRRKLQAALTAILALLLTIAFFVVASVVTARQNQLTLSRDYNATLPNLAVAPMRSVPPRGSGWVCDGACFSDCSDDPPATAWWY